MPERPKSNGLRVMYVLYLPACFLALVAWWLPILVIVTYGAGLLIGQDDTYKHDDWLDERYGH